MRASLSEIKHDNSVFASPSDTFIRPGVSFPAIGLKDGPTNRTDLSGGMIEYDIVIHVCLFVYLFREEAVLLDDPATDSPGVLTFADQVDAVLDENLLSIDGMIHAAQFQSLPSRILFNGKEFAQSKILKYRYELEASRP